MTLLAAIETLFSWLMTRWDLWRLSQYMSNDLIGRVTRLIVSQSLAIRTKSGGRIHRVNRHDAHTIALYVNSVAYQNKAGELSIALLLAWLSGESRCDPRAYNPNKQLAKPNETEEEAFSHADIGIAQFDGAGLRARPEFAHESVEAIKQIAFTIDWAIPAFALYVEELLAWAKVQIIKPTWPTLTYDYAADYLLLAAQAYNVGRDGALALDSNSNWRYAIALLDRYARFRRILGSL